MKVNSAWWTSSWIFFFLLSQNNRRVPLSATVPFEEQLLDYHLQPLLQAASPIRCVSLHVTVLFPSAHFYLSHSSTAAKPLTVTATEPKQFLTSKQSCIASFSFLVLCHSRTFFYLCIASICPAGISEYYWLQTTALQPSQKWSYCVMKTNINLKFTCISVFI